MKKLISLVLVLVCVLALAACAPTADTGTKDIFALAEAKATPTRIVTGVKYLSDGTAYEGRYVTESEGQNAIMTYSYQRPARLDEMADSEMKTVTGKLYYKDGKVSSDGATYETESLGWTGVGFTLVKDALTEIRLSEDGRELTAQVAPANAEQVFGSAIETDGTDILLTVKSNGTHLTAVNIAYTAKSGAQVTIDTSRSYNAVQLDFPSDK